MPVPTPDLITRLLDESIPKKFRRALPLLHRDSPGYWVVAVDASPLLYPSPGGNVDCALMAVEDWHE
jgi:hypothetical protein